jgi:type VI secretion system protein ImpK
MQFTTDNSPFLQSFQIFYYELLRQKEKALRMSEPDNLFYENSSGQEDIGLIDGIQKKMRALLEEQAYKLSRSVTGIGATQVRDGQYLMTILTDEIFLTLSWPGAKQWQKSLLEAQIFETQIAGEVFYKKLDALLDSTDPARSELALLYFLILSLGFRGKFRDQDDKDAIKWYLNQLYTVINHRTAHLFRPGRPHLIDQAYDYTLSEPPGRGLPDMKTWGLCIAGIFTVYVFITYVVWYKLASEMHEALNLIFEQTRQSPLI